MTRLTLTVAAITALILAFDVALLIPHEPKHPECYVDLPRAQRGAQCQVNNTDAESRN